MTNSTNTVSNAEEQDSCCSNSSCCGPETPVTRSAPKIGRNEPCICGSSKKFKKCCGA
ncbi:MULTISPECIES: SEC-C metal-binding domain-containing protein [unclassified Oleiphilus]|uniref:SEC-C metal-binding domain-containing protein n=1 Tax=unclassified Oleiphilus TaxID=2631174 RepID=UPI0009EE813B